ncbi:MAG: molybdopterin-dependent oxidoreductase [Candidatus Moranbacteria bacterium]|nr:molybdopterin-dependent oxidoreductase [Candidatus Moranbacteria bacterium]
MRKDVIIFICAVVVGSALLAVRYYFDNGDIERLKSVAVENYEGEDLSSIDDFIENSIKGPQYVDRKDYKLKIKNTRKGDIAYSYDDILNNFRSYEKRVTLNCVVGWSVDILWKGVLVRDVIGGKENIPDGAKIIIFRSYDGYSTSLPIEYVMNNDIIMAHTINNTELPSERGFPFQLVAESKFGYKWIKWITEIEFSDDENFRGYWESRGYSNSGDLDKNFLEE